MGFDFKLTEAKRENLGDDRACDSDKLGYELPEGSVEKITFHIMNGKRSKTQDTPRWLVERLFAWIQWRR